MDWETLNTAETFEAAMNASNNHPVVLFKHSTRCSISRMALKMIRNEWDLPPSVRPFLLDLLAHRDVSQLITEQLNVRPESPQLLLIQNGKGIHHASHDRIDASALKAYL